MNASVPQARAVWETMYSGMDQRTKYVLLWRRWDRLRNRLIVRPASPALREQNAYYCGDKVVVTMFVMSRRSVLCTVARCLFSCVFGLIFLLHSFLPLTGNWFFRPTINLPLLNEVILPNVDVWRTLLSILEWKGVVKSDICAVSSLE